MSVVLVHKGRLFCFYTSRSWQLYPIYLKTVSWFEWRAARGIVSGRDPTRSVGRDEVGTCSDEANSNQLYCFYILKRCLELLQETEVILEIIAEVAHLPLKHGNTLNTHTECETAVLLAVNA